MLQVEVLRAFQSSCCSRISMHTSSLCDSNVMSNDSTCSRHKTCLF